MNTQYYAAPLCKEMIYITIRQVFNHIIIVSQLRILTKRKECLFYKIFNLNSTQMKATIGIYKTHDEAVKAVKALQESGFPMKDVSIIGNAEMVDGHMHVKSKLPEEVGYSAGITAGVALGVLSGIGIFAVPGFGFLYGAGALVGAFVGFDMGAIGGGLLAILSYYGVNKDEVIIYNDQLKEGKQMLIVKGDGNEIVKAKEILEKQTNHQSVAIH